MLMSQLGVGSIDSDSGATMAEGLEGILEWRFGRRSERRPATADRHDLPVMCLPLDNQINYIIRPDSELVDWQTTYTNKLPFLFSRHRSSRHGDYASLADLNGSKGKHFHPHWQPPHDVLISLCLVFHTVHCTCRLCGFGCINDGLDA